jgi:hypothetical protein
MAFKDTIVSALRKLIPVDRYTNVDTRSEPAFAGRGITADTIHNALRSAEQGTTRDLFALYRDVVLSGSHLQGVFNTRKLSVIGNQIQIQSADETASDKAVDIIQTALGISRISAVSTREVGRLTMFRRACIHLLDSSLYPVAVLEKTFQPDASGYTLKALVPVPHHLLEFTTGQLRIHDVDPVTGFVANSTHEADPNRYIIHRGNLLTYPDNWGGPMRSLLFWWLLAVMDREWWGRMLERYGSPFMIGKYDSGDDQARTLLAAAFRLATRLGGLVIPRHTEVELQAALSSDSGEAYEKFLNICNDEQSKLVVGQTLSSTAKPTGLGSGVANLQSGVRDDIRQFDSIMLADTLRDQLFNQIIEINRLDRPAPTISFGQEMDSEQAAQSGTLLSSLGQAGLEPTDDGLTALSKKVGFPLQRMRRPSVSPMSVHTLAVQPGLPLNSVAANTASDLSQAFSGAFAPIRRIILSSESPADCERLVREYLADDYSPARVASIIQDALTAYTANGSVA